MTVIAVLVDPPRPGLVLPELAATSPLSRGEAARLYRAMAADALQAAAASGGDLLVNYRPDDQLPEEFVPGDADAEGEVRALVRDALDEEGVEEARVEVQVGSTKAARVGNTISHLLQTEEAHSAAVLEPDAPLFFRKDVDSAAMKLRRSEVVLGPAQGGHVYFAGFREPVDFTDAYATPEVESLAARALDAGYDVDFLGQHARVRTGADLASVLAEVRARRGAGRVVPAHTTAFLEDLDLRVVDDEDGGRTVARRD